MQKLICSENIYKIDIRHLIEHKGEEFHKFLFFFNKLKNLCNKLFEYYGHECVQTFRIIYGKKIIFKRTYFQTFEKQYQTNNGLFP